MSAKKEQFAVVNPAMIGPKVEFYRSMDAVASLLMDWARIGCDCKADTVWKRVRGKWVPAFPWQHGEAK